MAGVEAKPAAVAVAPENDLMLKLLAAQFALQNDDLAAAAQGYAEAAELSADPAVAEEATRLALSVKQWPLARRALTRWQQLAPKESGIVQARAVLALGEQRIDDAYADLSALAARADEQGWRLVAQVLLNAPDKAVATQLLERLATPEHLAAKETNWVAMSQLAFKLGDKALAQRLVDRAVAKFHGAEGYAWSARLALDRGDKAAAQGQYAAALKRDPDSLRLRGGYAALLADSGDNAAAARALERGPQDDVTYAARAAYAARGEDKAALVRLYREMQADKGERSGKRLYLLGQVGELLDRSEEALNWYREIGDGDEHWFDAQMRQAVLLDQLGRNAEAVDFLHQLQAQTGEDIEQLGSAYLLEAELQVRRQRPRDALAVYGRALGVLPDDTRLLYARALLEVDQGDADAAERDLRRVVELKPDDAEAMNALGYTLVDSSSRGDPKLAEARELIRRAIELKPNEPAIIDSLGWLHYRLGDLDASLKQLRRAYEKQTEPDIAAHLGEVLWVKGERDEARRIWEEGRKKDPKNKVLLETIKRLNP
ncbi:tetratricopeptide repeat protein [Dokdonella sp.]|uniref:tetratricopeptide repeat protein n=1 Tax=Dokdonella sp. TaxID=2291710 RepID=UPI001B112C62|nr:tetratricopeptide repeat protein [Dokdonella sp.]MBO9663649.1 tetratricopeptide repeat protein [Dokdonella sp.]